MEEVSKWCAIIRGEKKMTLIDADKLIDNLDNMIPADDGGDYVMGIATAIQEVGRMAYEDYIEAIPIEWLKSHLPNMDDYILMKGYPMFDEDNPLNTAYDKGFSDGWKACCKAIITDLLADWEEENSN